jgi:hypothetical protein
MDINFDKFSISHNLPLPTEKDIEEYLWVLRNQHQGYVWSMANLAIPKLILLAEYYKKLYEQALLK